MSGENLKYVYFVSTQVRCLVQKRHPFLPCKETSENESFLAKLNTKTSKISNKFLTFFKSVSHENFKYIDFVSAQVRRSVQKGRIFSHPRKFHKMNPVRQSEMLRAFRILN